VDDLLRRGLVEGLAHGRMHGFSFVELLGGNQFAKLFDASLQSRLHCAILRSQFQVLTMTLLSTFCVGHSNNSKQQRPSD